MQAIDVNTLLDAFRGQIKPGSVEEQSVRTAYDLAKKGDVATATNILKYISIPESLKVQVLGASAAINPETTFDHPQAVVGAPLVADQPAKKLPEPLLGMEMPKPGTVAQIAEPIPIPMHSPFDTELGSVVPRATALPTMPIPNAAPAPVSSPVGGVPLAIPVPMAPQPVSGVSSAVTAETISAIAQIPAPPIAPGADPMHVLPHQRQEAFNSMFASARADAANQTSKPMIMEDAMIPVIHTYEEPAPSSFALAQEQQTNTGLGEKQFAVLSTLVSRALASGDEAVCQVARRQWDSFNHQFLDYKSLHMQEWNALADQMKKLDETPTPVPQPETMPVALTTSDLPVPPIAPAVPSADTIQMPVMPMAATSSVPPPSDAPSVVVPSTDISPAPAVGSYFARKAKAAPATTEAATDAANASPSRDVGTETNEKQISTTDAQSAPASNAPSVVQAVSQSNTSNVVTDGSSEPEIPHHEVLASIFPSHATEGAPAVAAAPSSFFQKHAKVTPSKNTTTQSPVVEPLIKEGEAAKHEIEHLEVITLPSGITVKKNLTITGESIFRVADIEHDITSSTHTVVFTDEVHKFRVPEPDLDAALHSPETEPDDFFVKYQI